MAYPRDEIVDKLVKPINSKAVRMDSLMLFPGEPGYADMIKNSGVAKYTKGTQAEREAAALALVRKHSATDVKGQHALGSTKQRSSCMLKHRLQRLLLARAGFELNAPGRSGWSGFLDSSEYDAQFFAWVKSALTAAGNTDIFTRATVVTTLLAT